MTIKFYLKKWTVSTIIIVESLITGGSGLPCVMSSAHLLMDCPHAEYRAAISLQAMTERPRTATTAGRAESGSGYNSGDVCTLII